MQHPLLKPLRDNEHLSGPQALDAFLTYVEGKNLTLYPAQEEAILNIFENESVILNTPTGSGKSLVALAMHFKSLAAGRRSVYTCPIKALVNEKFLALCHDFGPEQVGMITGDGKVNENAPILLCTAEILANMALREGEMTAFDDVILDEFHYYADRDRGVSWQIPLLSLSHCRFLLMSATMGDSDHFKRSIEDLTQEPCSIVSSTDRPVPLSFSYRETPIEQTVEQLFSEGKAPIYLVNFTQKDAAELAQNFLSLNFCSKEEKAKIAEAIEQTNFNSPYGKEVKKLIKHGIGIHHGGLLPKYRILVETLAQKGLLKIICGTDTLGVGVNVPIRTVVFTKLCKFDGQKTAILSSRDFHQISGRAGRKGFDDHGYIICQAPAHVIENRKLEQKALANPKKKFVKAKPPEKGYVAWNEETFLKLIDAPCEKLRSVFQVNHGMLINVLSRKEDGCQAMKELLLASHESPVNKRRHKRHAFQLFRALIKRQIVEFIAPEEIEEKGLKTKIRVNINLQDDFSLTQSLSLYLIDTLALLDPFDPAYGLNMLSLVEAILEDPDLILFRQLDKIKREKLAELREAGVDYEDRVTELEKLEYPKPNRDFIYSTFNEFAAKYPWMVSENIRPKGIARQMFDNYHSFPEYIKEYGLERVEGLLLRYLSSTYKVLTQTVPFDLKNDDVDDMIAYFETIVKTTDSSLVDEWEKIKNPTWTKKDLAQGFEDDHLAISRNEKAFTVLLRNAVFHCLRALASKDYEQFLRLTAISEQKIWSVEELETKMALYFADHEAVRTDISARSPKNLVIRKSSPSMWEVELVLCDTQDFNDWLLLFAVDLAKADEMGKPVLEFLDARAIS